MAKRQQINKSRQKNPARRGRDKDYFLSMSDAPTIDESIGFVQTLPLIFFTAVVICMVRMVQYARPMEQFFWTNGGNDQVDFFSYCKMIAILICAVLVLLMLLYRVFTQSFAIKRTFAYIPMIVYSAFVILSYIFSDYKEFSLLGYVDRFEGTLVLLSYMILLFYAINTVNSERNIKFVLYPVAIMSALLGLLGVSQATDHDFFRTRLGGMMITPQTYWEHIDKLSFTFKNKEIYQTVYNINYVSFYLTLLIPIFGLLFIKSMTTRKESISKKITWGLLFALLIFNLIGSASSGGFFGMGVVVLLAIIILNKQILSWWKPLAVLLIMTVAVAGITSDRWLPELKASFGGVSADGGGQVESQGLNYQSSEGDTAKKKSYIDYMEVIPEEDRITFSIEGNEVTFIPRPESVPPFDAFDAEGNLVEIGAFDSERGIFPLTDKRFAMCGAVASYDENGQPFFIVKTDERDWVYMLTAAGTYHLNDIGKVVEMGKVDAIGFKNHQSFGSGRGYIWSRSIPMMKDTLLIGHGADTYCMYFPQNDYIGKYNADWVLTMIVDKPHDMYLAMGIGTGVVSLLAWITLLAFYAVQSIRIYWRRRLTEFAEFAGFGIFLGILGFAFTGLVDDSSVSVMPMFYGLLGMGIAVNEMVKRLPESN